MNTQGDNEALKMTNPTVNINNNEILYSVHCWWCLKFMRMESYPLIFDVCKKCERPIMEIK